jgi:ABC-type glycerol-3-phosphate transport system permease component
MSRSVAALPQRSFRLPRPGRVATYVLLTVFSLLMVAPVFYAFLTSFKPTVEIMAPTPTFLPSSWTIANYVRLPQAAPFFQFFLNSMIVSTVSTVIVIAGSTVAGYVFAKYQFPGKSLLFMLVVATILVPMQVYLVPLYTWARLLNWINTYQGLTFPLIISSSGIFFLRQSIFGIPDELIDAARVDGASEFTILWRLIFPLSTAAMAAIGIVNWVYTWSQFIWPLIIAASDKMYTMEVGTAYFQRQFVTEYGPVMAGTMISLAPVLVVFLVFRTRIIEGIATTGLKG